MTMASSLADPELPSSQSEVLVDEAGALVYYHPWVLHQAEAASLFAELRDRLDWRRERDDFGVQDRCEGRRLVDGADRARGRAALLPSMQASLWY